MRFSSPKLLALLAPLALALPVAAHADTPLLPDAWLKILELALGQAPKPVDPLWGDGNVELALSDGKLQATLRGNIAVGAAGAVDVATFAASGTVRQVTYGGAAADWLVRGGLVIVRLGPDAARRGEVTVVQDWPFSNRIASTVVIGLPAWTGGHCTKELSGAEVFGPDENGQLRPENRGVLVRGGLSTSPRIRAARYAISFGTGVATIDLRIEVEARGSDGAVAFAEKTMALIDLQVDGKPVAPISSGGDSEDDAGKGDDWHKVAVGGRGLRLISARLQVAADGSGDEQEITVGRVAAPITEVRVRTAGKRGVRFEPEVPVQTQNLGGQAEIHAYLPVGEELKVATTLEGDAVEKTVRFGAETWQVLTLDEGLLKGKATLDLSVMQGKLTALQVALPDGAQVTDVQGAEVATWDNLAAAGDLPRRLRIGLKDGGDAAEKVRHVVITFERPLQTKPDAELKAPFVHPLGAFREAGAVALLDGEKVGFAPVAGAAGWLKAGIDVLPADIRRELDGRADQVWRHVGAPAELPVKLAAARVREVRMEARSTALVRIDERTLQSSHVIVVDVKAGRTDKLILDLPDFVAEPHIVAPSLSRTAAAEGQTPDKGRKLWELRFSSALEGAVQLQVDCEFVLQAGQKSVALPDVRVKGAEVETGVLALAAEPGLELAPATKGETRTIPTTELPEAVARQAGRDLVAGFRSPRGAVLVDVGLTKRATVSTLNAFVTQAWLYSNLLDDGRIASRMVLLLHSEGRPVLKVALPAKSEVLALVVDGAHVKAVRDDKGELAVPLGRATELRVEIRYEQRGDPVGLLGRVAFAAPKLDVRQGPLQWQVSWPGERHAYAVSSDLRHLGDWGIGQPPQKDGEKLIELPLAFAARYASFSSEVRDAGAGAEVVLWLGWRPGAAAGWLLLGGGLVLGWLWRRRRGRQLAAGAGLALLAGLAVLGMNDGADLPVTLVGLAVFAALAAKGARWAAGKRWKRVAPVPVPAAAPAPGADSSRQAGGHGDPPLPGHGVAPPPPPPPRAADDRDAGGES